MDKLVKAAVYVTAALVTILINAVFIAAIAGLIKGVFS